MVDAVKRDPEAAELRGLLEAIFVRYGYDFRRYARSSLDRRVRHLMQQSGLASLGQLQQQVLQDGATFHALVDALTIRVTEMFRDPAFYASFRREVVPLLRTYPMLKLWMAGCASGEEAHSLAILLHEEGLDARSVIYATDLSPSALERARAGIYPAEQLVESERSYRAAGGTASFRSYFTVAHGHAALLPALTRNLHFAEHNLVSDEVFGEMNVIFCRNVLIYFERELQNDAIALLCRSLIRGGFLCLGAKESLRLSRHAHVFDELEPGSRIFRKKVTP